MRVTVSALLQAIICLWLDACGGPSASTHAGYPGGIDQGVGLQTESEHQRMQRIVNGVR